MKELTIDDLLTKAKNKFLLSNAAAGRAKQITQGSLPYINNFDPNNPVITALREIAADKIKIKILSGSSKKAQEIVIKKDDKKSKSSLLDSLSKGSKKGEKKVVKKKKK